MTLVPIPILDLHIPLDSVLFGSCPLTSEVTHISGISLRALRKSVYLMLVTNLDIGTTIIISTL